MITRTILGTKAITITVDTATLEVEQRDYTIGGEWTDNNKLLKAIKKTYEHGTTVISAVIKTEKVEKLYGMTEEFFMAHAVELDAETRKPLTVTGVNPSDTAVADNSTSDATAVADNSTSDATAVEAPTTDNADNGVAITAPITVTEVSAKAEKIPAKNNKNK